MSDEAKREFINHEPPTASGPAAETPAVQFRVGMVLKVVAPIALLGIGALLFFGFFDGATWIANLISPARVPVTGQVLFNSEPLAGAVIATRPVQGSLRGAIATADEQGRFKLVTEINGDFLAGAFAGEHVVTVKGYHDIPSMGEQPLLTPREYSSFEASPLRITVSAAQQEMKIELTGTPSERPPGPGFVPGSQRPAGNRVQEGGPEESGAPPGNTTPAPSAESK